MKSKGCEFGYYNGLSYRICYGLTNEGKMDYSKQIYEFSKYCKCSCCNYRFKHTRGVNNNLTVSTDDKSKFQEIYEMLSGYTCNSDRAKERTFVRL